MKICSNCGYENIDNGKFCSECGTKLQAPSISCPECGYNLLSGEAASCQNDEIEDEEYTETGLVEDSSNSEEDTESEKVYAFETVDFDTIDYNDLSDYTIDELDYIEWHIDSYSDFDYRKSLRILVRNEMGKRYFMGDGVEVDKGKAFELFMKSASSGDPCAQFILGKCYEEGYGTEVKEQTAFKWYKKAAEQGIAEA
ncbi:MAG: zinc-ribbon domain-containing protein [Spirochaetia bacterium]|nr:zinc-ribbon domain-containing protein [Spirochaetia bacterium]